MKLTKKLEAEILKAYTTLWDANLKGDIKTFASFLDNNITVFGTAAGEIFTTKKEAVKFYTATVDQMTGKAEFRKRKIAVKAVGDTVVINEQCHLYVLAEKVWMFYGHARITAIFEKKGNSWKVVHMHGSFPDSRTEEGEQLNTDKIKAENIQLRDAIKRRTIELEEKNRELEIETAFERVRTVAMSMRHSNDLTSVCKIMNEELIKLGFDNIRNSQIAINDDAKQLYVNYEYAAYDGESITDVAYNSHRKVKAMVKKMKESKDAFFSLKITGKELIEWRRFRIKIGQRKDQKLAKAKAVCYYFYSVGNGALGISTFDAISKEQLLLLQRFRNVFLLAYKRFTDIQRAEAQAKEVRIELALERVRARAMAMYNSNELAELVSTVFNELTQLDFKLTSCIIWIHDRDTMTNTLWIASAEMNKHAEPFLVNVFHNDFFRSINHAWRSRDIKWVYTFTGKEKKDFEKAFFKELPHLPIPLKKALKDPKQVVFSASFNNFGALEIVETEALTDEKFEILHRFGKVFDLSYTRFNDLKKAEAQAREAQIEAALERVRARSMAMHHSNDLQEVIRVLSVQLLTLGLKFDTATFAKTHQDGSWDLWISTTDQPYPAQIHVPYFDHPIFNEINQASDQGQTYSKRNYTFELKNTFFKHFFENTVAKNIPEARKQYVLNSKGYARSVFLLRNITLSVANYEGIDFTDEEDAMLQRFANVFEQSYTRFLDLQKAEAQAREAQIEAALERIRSRSMAMHQSNELSEVASVVFEQLNKLGISIVRTWINIFNAQTKTSSVWITSLFEANAYPVKVILPLDKNDFIIALHKQWKDGAEHLKYSFIGEEATQYNRTLRELTGDATLVPDEILNEAFSYHIYEGCHKYGTVGVSFLEPVSKEIGEIINRFAKVFEQTYTRFLDLEKAEAQAREAQIEAGLERVRSRGMAMQTSEELGELIGTLLAELTKLDLVLTRCVVWIIDPKTKDAVWWMANSEDPTHPMDYSIAYHEEPPWLAFMNEWKKRTVKWVYDLKGKTKKEWDEHLFSKTGLAKMPKFIRDAMRAPERILLSASFSNFGGMNVASLEPLSEEHFDILLRFARVFDLTYTRFNDLKQAEAQAREAQIEAALEKIRSRSLAMHSSTELKEVIAVTFEKLNELKLLHGTVAIQLFDWEKMNSFMWVGNNIQKPQMVNLPYDKKMMSDDSLIKDEWEAKKNGADIINKVYSFKQKNRFFNFIFLHNDLIQIPQSARELLLQMKNHVVCLFTEKNSALFVDSFDGKLFSTDEQKVIKRTAKVFEQAYIRFLDLQKAEEQARESQIQLALERVRARTMAMQHSDELKNAATLLFQQVKSLGVPAYSCGYNIWEKGEKEFTSWMSTQDGTDINAVLNIPLTEDANFIRFDESRENGEQFFVLELRGERMQEHYQYLKTIPAFRAYFDYAVSVGFPLPETQIHHLANFSHGNLLFITLEPCPEFHDVFKRFATVFDQTYTRFLDLKQAEAQAREAQIETALERVRSRTMAMHRSEEVADIVGKIFTELKQLDLVLNRVLIWIFNDDEKFVSWWSANPESESNAESYRIDYNDQPVFLSYLHAWQKRVPLHLYTLSGDNKRNWEDHLFANTELSKLPAAVRNGMREEGTIFTTSTISDYGLMMVGSFEPLSLENTEIIQRFDRVFQQSYTRYLDVQKAEAQARESQIQLALERVRARTMAMQKSDELPETSHILYEQMKELGEPVEQLTIGVVQEENKVIEISATLHGDILKKIYRHSIDEPFMMSKIYHAWKTHQKTLIVELKGDELNAYNKYRNELTRSEMFPTDLGDEHRRIVYAAFFSKGMLALGANEPRPPESLQLLERFAGVFDQAYIRFIDLKKAEAQSRESQIQLALERVRARTMAMQKSEELPETSLLLFQQMKEFGETVVQNSIGIIKEEEGLVELSTTVHGHHEPKTLHVPINDPHVMAKAVAAWKAKRKSLTLEFKGQELKDYNELRNSFLETKVNFPEDNWVVNIVFFSKGWLSFSSNHEISKESFRLLERFAGVFDLTYTRFLDLKQAEGQARESQIQLALERVRARTMAMQKSDELAETSSVLFQQFNELNEGADQISIGIFDEDEEMIKLYSTFHGNPWDQPARIEYNKHPVYRRMVAAWKDHKRSFVTDLSGAELQDFNKFKAKIPGYQIPEDELAKDRWVVYTAYFSNGLLSYASHEPRPKESIQLLERFATVFDGTYTRFLDLQKAETQARESQIQLALERVRARTMAMQKSNELADAAQLLYKEFRKLGISTFLCGYIFYKEEQNRQTAWVTLPDGTIIPDFVDFPLMGDPVLDKRFEDWKQKKPLHILELKGEANKEHHRFLASKVSDANASKVFAQIPDRIIFYCANFSAGYLFIIATEFLTDDEEGVIIRFAKVFELTYTRFNDLKQAELQGRESQIQLALERVRARTMAMQKSEELSETAAVLFQQFNGLGQELMQMTIGIVNEADHVIEFSVTDWGGSGAAVNRSFNLSIDEPTLIKKMYTAWREQKKSVIVDLTGVELESWIHYRNAMSGVPVHSQDTQGRRVITSAFFSKGHISFSTPEPPAAESVQILERFAGVFDLTYTRFLDLKQAEAQVREAQIEAGLERVRSRSLAMHNTSELQDVIHTVHRELLNLNIAIHGGSFITINSDIKTEVLRCWGSGGTANTSEEVHLPFYNKPFCLDLINGIKKGPGFFTEEFTQQEKKDFFTFLFNYEPWSKLDTKQKEETLLSPGGYTRSCCVSQHTSIFIINHYGEKFSAADNDILKRFGKVFEQSYTRFLDLQKAEAQAREAQIELALERVRARTMAMHQSEELAETAQVMFHQLNELGGAPDRISIGVVDEATGVVNFWSTDQSGSHINNSFKARLNERTVISKTYNAWKEHKKSLIIDLHGDELKEWIQFAREEMNIVVKDENIHDRRIHNLAFFSHGWILVTTHEPQSAETIQILERFASVFNLTYRRFLDLQKAEAQAREAKIEAALEKVRARTMGMQHSDELPQAANLLFQQIQSLGMPAWSAGYCIWDDNDKKNLTAWMSSEGVLQPPFKAPTTEDELFIQMREGSEQGKALHVVEMGGEKLIAHYKYMRTLPVVGAILDSIIEAGHPLPTFQIMHHAYFSKGFLLFITYEPVLTAHDIFKRFAIVFDQTYTRFLDLQKAEAQAREAQIEAALERVRSTSLAMHHSDELEKVVVSLFERLVELGLTFHGAGIYLFEKEKRNMYLWVASKVTDPVKVNLPYDAAIANNSINQDLWNLIETRQDLINKSYSGPPKDDYYRYIGKYNESKIPESVRIMMIEAKSWTASFAVEKNCALLIDSWEGRLTSNEDFQIVKRFAKVFEQAYTRFLDLQKAEAQAREAQIEAALERVRSRSLAMHKSDELQEVVNTVFERLTDLNVDMGSCNIAIFKEGTRDFDYWIASPVQKRSAVFHVPYMDLLLTKDLIKAKEDGLDFFTKAYSFDEKNEWFEYAYEHSDFGLLPAERKKFFAETVGISFSIAFAKNTALQINNFSAKLPSEGEIDILKRFSKVFEQAYTRFLDLQKAEAQAREAQIEAGLERVRARTMAMHSSDDVSVATATMFTELEKLGIQNLRGGITIINPDQMQEVWSVTNLPDGRVIRAIGVFDMRLHPLWRALLEGKEKKEDYLYYWMAGKDKQDYINILNATPNYLVQPIKDFPDVHVQSYFFGEGAIWTNSMLRHSDEDKQIMKRFASVFSLTFRRYQDLQKAEAQAREATIEAALERVRGKAMAMHSSKDLVTTIGVFYHELEGLNLTPRRCGVGLIDKETYSAEISTMNATADGRGIELVGKLDMRGHPVLMGVYNNWLTKTEYHPVLRGDEIKDYYQFIRPQVDFPGHPNDSVQYGYFFFFDEGGVYAWTEKELQEEELKIYRRFTSVLSLTYKRYKDLRDAETRAQNAIKEAALDRIRADIASMRTVEDLDRITPLIWTELTTLSIPFIRCGVFIMDDLQQFIHTFLSTPDGKAIAAFHLPYDTPGSIGFVISNWRNKKQYVDHWDEEEFTQFADILMKEGALASREQYLKTIPKGGFYLHFLPFLQGMLYVGNTTRLNNEETELIQHVADAFSTAYARYEDFNRLEAAKKTVENTLTDLKQAQQQLVQSEKMASLGELTAGIAHEIQNPLNFVNNFSDVSNELLEEMKAELEKGNKEDAIAIVEDVKQNLEKILHHGKRADAIVKGMLQHSRTSSGQKEMTDINVLADEYLRLAFHGLRAKDKTFNAKFETHFDNNIGKINIIPQDIGRVILNLINNAFYTVTEKKKGNQNGYEPTVTVTTLKENGKIEIKVKDNGNGIPQKNIDKIFQPFFTTKPTGQGTGLGLSLAYDIITKGHGGELKVETKEGEGSEFVIQLPG